MVATIQGGVDAGDMIAENPAVVLKLSFTGWALAFGIISLMMSSLGVFLTQQADREGRLFKSVQMLLDGGGWQLLSSEKDDEKSWQDIGCRFFAAELDELERRELNK